MNNYVRNLCGFLILVCDIVLISSGLLFVVHMSYTMMSDTVAGQDPKMISIFPIALFGIGHALFVTLMSPSIK
jgi:hypothetical protein